ncbi:MAG: hypothetical protein HXY25_05355 [Alphaproteobacteria bacterium]|nr:hypothetical protein [Alphaproteobacteria bacterium]
MVAIGSVIGLVLRLVISAAVATVLAAMLHTQFVIGAMQGIGMSVPGSERLAWTAHDILGMGPAYGVVMLAGFLLAFLVAAAVLRLVPGLRAIGYPLAGAAAVATALLLMETQFNGTMPIAGARSGLGFAAQVLAGAAGGFVFGALGRR